MESGGLVDSQIKKKNQVSEFGETKVAGICESKKQNKKKKGKEKEAFSLETYKLTLKLI